MLPIVVEVLEVKMLLAIMEEMEVLEGQVDGLELVELVVLLQY